MPIRPETALLSSVAIEKRPSNRAKRSELGQECDIKIGKQSMCVCVFRRFFIIILSEIPRGTNMHALVLVAERCWLSKRSAGSFYNFTTGWPASRELSSAMIARMVQLTRCNRSNPSIDLLRWAHRFRDRSRLIIKLVRHQASCLRTHASACNLESSK